jgi:hypothetical protein
MMVKQSTDLYYCIVLVEYCSVLICLRHCLEALFILEFLCLRSECARNLVVVERMERFARVWRVEWLVMELRVWCENDRCWLDVVFQ